MAVELFDILTFDHEVTMDMDVTTVEPDWTDVVHLVTPDRPAGVYSLGASLQFSFNSTTVSVLYQFSLDGGSTWGVIYAKEMKDRSDREVLEIVDILEHTGGVIDVICRMTQEADHALHVHKGMLTCQRRA